MFPALAEGDVTFPDRFADFVHFLPAATTPSSREVSPGCLTHRPPTMASKMVKEKVVACGACSKCVIDHDVRALAINMGSDDSKPC